AAGARRLVPALAVNEQQSVSSNAEVVRPLVAEVRATEPISLGINRILRDAKNGFGWELDGGLLGLTLFRGGGTKRCFSAQASPHDVDFVCKVSALVESAAAEK